jgi:serine/threonine protein kinase
MNKIHLDGNDWLIDLDSPLGSPGGFGAVFEGEGPDGKPVAIKQLKLSFDNVEKRELNIAVYFAGKNFKHVTAVLASGEFEGRHYIVMDRADESLADHISSNSTGIGIEDTVRVMLDIADGLAEVPEIVHRDLKPQKCFGSAPHGRSVTTALHDLLKMPPQRRPSNTFARPGMPRPSNGGRSERQTPRTYTHLGALGLHFYAGYLRFRWNAEQKHEMRTCSPTHRLWSLLLRH